MSDDKRPRGIDDAPDGDSIAAQKARAMLSNPKLKDALHELKAATPEGEPLFGFELKTKDARAEVPAAEEVKIEEGAAVVAQREAAAAYVEAASPAAGVSPRMPTGKVRFGEKAAGAAWLDPRQQVTQPSLKRGGTGERPPALAGEEEERTGAGAVIDKGASAAIVEGMAEGASAGAATAASAGAMSVGVGAAMGVEAPPSQAPLSREIQERKRRPAWAAIGVGAALVTVVAIALRGPRGSGGMEMGSATAPSVPSVAATSAASATAEPSAMASGPVVGVSTGVPFVSSAAVSPAVPSVTKSVGAAGVPMGPSGEPTNTVLPPAVTGAPSTMPSAGAISNASSAGTAPPAPPPTVQASTAPVTTSVKPVTDPFAKPIYEE